MLTDLEVANIEQGLVDIHSLGEDIAVPFSAARLANASVLWINERWFLERNIDVTDKAVRARLDQWLIEEYAFIVPPDDDAPSAVGEANKTFWADRYGSADKATHGGSGRVGIFGRFQVKGVGRTPLVGVTYDWLHSHGCLWIEEALREAIYSEITANEFPHGAVPVLAVIDAGLRYRNPNGEEGERRALSIRPMVVRPAYFERAIAFRPLGSEHEARKSDVRRVKQVVRYFEGEAGKPQGRTLPQLFAEVFARLAQQIAFGRAHRLFPGNYSSSNFSMDGALLDFGAFRALPNWCRYVSMNNVSGFGEEVLEQIGIVESIAFYIGKYKSGEAAGLDSEETLRNFTQELENAFAREVLYIFHLEDCKDDVVRGAVLAAVFEYYKVQQRFDVRYQNGFGKKLQWLGDIFAGRENLTGSHLSEREVFSKIDVAINLIEGERERALLRQRMRATAARLLPARPEIDREAMATAINTMLAAVQDGQEIIGIDAAVDSIISRNRRHWTCLPRNLIVLAQSSGARCSVLYCFNPETEEYFLWMEAASVAGRIWCRDKWVPRSVVEPYEYRSNGTWWFGLFPARADAPIAILPGIDFQLPENAIRFDAADSSWLNEYFVSEDSL